MNFQRQLPEAIIRLFSLKRLVALSLFGLLTACGGGDDAPTPCSTQPSLALTLTWNSNGTLAQTVNGKLNVPLVATPIVTGVPASCVAQQSYAITQDSFLPAGLTLNTSTGVISGTPTQAISIGGIASVGLVSLTYPGYKPIPALGIITIFP